MSPFIKIGKLNDFPENQGTRVELKDRSVCIVRSGNDVFAFDDRCTHAESLLSGGDVENGEISCPLHGARFSIKTGEAMTLPAVKPVKMHEVKVDGELVFIKMEENT